MFESFQLLIISIVAMFSLLALVTWAVTKFHKKRKIKQRLKNIQQKTEQHRIRDIEAAKAHVWDSLYKPETKELVEGITVENEVFVRRGDRRSGIERRREQIKIEFADRRSGKDRRTRTDRRRTNQKEFIPAELKDLMDK